MTVDEKKQLAQLVQKYIDENKNSSNWGRDAAKELKAALTTEWLLNYRYIADPK